MNTLIEWICKYWPKQEVVVFQKPRLQRHESGWKCGHYMAWCSGATPREAFANWQRRYGVE